MIFYFKKNATNEDFYALLNAEHDTINVCFPPYGRTCKIPRCDTNELLTIIHDEGAVRLMS